MSRHHAEPSGRRATAAARLAAALARYPGPALTVGAAGGVAANDAGRELAALLGDGRVPELAAALERLAAAGPFAQETVAVGGADGERWFILTIVPGAGGAAHVLCREITLQRNLRTALAESRQRYKDLVEIISDFAWETDADGRFVFVSPRGALGYAADKLVGRDSGAFLVGAGDERRHSPFAAREVRDRVPLWFRRADGATACLEASCTPLFDDDGTWRGARGVCRDVTAARERDAALAAARNRERLHAYILRAIRDEVDPDQMLGAAARAVARALSAGACQIYRFAGMPRLVPAAQCGETIAAELVERVFADLGDGGAVVEASVGGWQIAAAATRYHREVTGALCLGRRRDAPAWTEEDREVLRNAADQVAIAIEQVAHHESLRRLSRTDTLTALLNRRAFFDEVERRLEAGRRRRPGSLLYVDLDNFKLVNDRLGHQVGDEVLRTVARMLTDNARSGDLVARLGGDEFALWLDGSDAAGAARKAASLIAEGERLSRDRSPDPGRPLGLSVGVAPYAPAETLDELIGRADIAMYQAKHNGKGGYCVAPPQAEAVA